MTLNPAGDALADTLYIDGQLALVDDMLLTLLPGESAIFTVTSALDIDGAAFAAATLSP